MGRDKSRLKFRGKTMLGHIKEAAKATGLPVRVIRRDAVSRCGPLGGIYTALRNTRAARVLFLACDMPFVSTDLIRYLLRRKGREAVFVCESGRAGFPLTLLRESCSLVEDRIKRKRLSVQSLGRAVGARVVAVPRRFSGQLRNINTPAEWEQAMKDWGLRWD